MPTRRPARRFCGFTPPATVRARVSLARAHTAHVCVWERHTHSGAAAHCTQQWLCAAAHSAHSTQPWLCAAAHSTGHGCALQRTAPDSQGADSEAQHSLKVPLGTSAMVQTSDKVTIVIKFLTTTKKKLR